MIKVESPYDPYLSEPHDRFSIGRDEDLWRNTLRSMLASRPESSNCTGKFLHGKISLSRNWTEKELVDVERYLSLQYFWCRLWNFGLIQAKETSRA